jgi:hypothetical protein
MRQSDHPLGRSAPRRHRAVAGRCAHVGRVAVRWAVAFAALLCAGLALAGDRIAVPDLPARPGVPAEVATQLVDAFRSALRDAGLQVSDASVVTPGIAGSLEVEFARLIAVLEGTRYAISGEIAARPGAGGEPYAVNLLAIDTVQDRTSDLISRPLAVATVPRVAAELSALVVAFVSAAPELPAGDAALFVSSVPRDAEVRIDGVPVGLTGRLDPVSLRPGRYELEVRKEGFLPEVRQVELRARDTRFVHIVLTEITGGSIRVTSVPDADVTIDGEPAGRTPVTVSALPGLRTVRLERPGFEPVEITEQVRTFRVTRSHVRLEPLHDTMLIWDETGPGLVIVDGILRRGGFAPVAVGLVRIEFRTVAESRSFLRAIPAPGVYVIDVATGDVEPLVPAP